MELPVAAPGPADGDTLLVEEEEHLLTRQVHPPGARDRASVGQVYPGREDRGVGVQLSVHMQRGWGTAADVNAAAGAPVEVQVVGAVVQMALPVDVPKCQRAAATGTDHRVAGDA